jgi:hypothetical protein
MAGLPDVLLFWWPGFLVPELSFQAKYRVAGFCFGSKEDGYGEEKDAGNGPCAGLELGADFRCSSLVSHRRGSSVLQQDGPD